MKQFLFSALAVAMLAGYAAPSFAGSDTSDIQNNGGNSPANAATFDNNEHDGGQGNGGGKGHGDNPNKGKENNSGFALGTL